MKTKHTKVSTLISIVILIFLVLTGCDIFEKIFQLNPTPIPADEPATDTPTPTPTPDIISPSLVLIGSSSMIIPQNQTFIDPGATATDNIDGDISFNIVISGDIIDTTAVGTYYIYYNVSDSSGNNAEQQTRTVIVETPCRICQLNFNKCESDCKNGEKECIKNCEELYGIDTEDCWQCTLNCMDIWSEGCVGWGCADLEQKCMIENGCY
ncbi:MAG: DUF5011 domain-containing protein [Spirochaetales bacterium]|nr:DUF5011 domain-containing protein [Spirochaetales bacterium]